jgi:AP-3 complex subunit mu
VEQLDCIIAADQKLITCSVFGEIRCNCRLTGMPDLTLTFTRSNLLDDCSLHRCVRINRYQRERVISFVPPDGNFKLLSYRVNGINQIPIYVKPNITYKSGSGRVHIMVGAKWIQEKDKSVTDVVIFIPLPKSTINTALTTNVGTVKHDPSSKLCRWEIGKMPKERTPVLEGNITLPVDFIPDESPTVRAEFQVKMMTVSGLKVDGLAIRGVKYKPFKGVRSVTQAGKFQVRCTTL